MALRTKNDIEEAQGVYNSFTKMQKTLANEMVKEQWKIHLKYRLTPEQLLIRVQNLIPK